MANKNPSDYRLAIERSGKDIYSPIEVGDPEHWIPTLALGSLLNDALHGVSLAGLPLRTRSKVVKSAICSALGYPVPKSFKRTRPRFLGQRLDIYTQKSRNLQIWNEELSPSRRYAIIQILGDNTIGAVKVVNGQELALLDTTGAITTKYQARLELSDSALELVSPLDTEAIQAHVRDGIAFDDTVSPVGEPISGELLPVGTIFDRLSPLVGTSFRDPGIDQERNRGAALHRLVCERLGYIHYEDKGRFPDIRHQLLEVKLQTSPTIDLGLVLPSDDQYLDVRQLGKHHPRHLDTRYAVFYGRTDSVTVVLTHLIVVTGLEFFTRFRRFEGKVTNRKLQILLPSNFFDA